MNPVKPICGKIAKPGQHGLGSALVFCTQDEHGKTVPHHDELTNQTWSDDTPYNLDDTPEDMHYEQHRLHTVTVGHDGVNRCSCGEAWRNMVGRTHLDAALTQGD